MKQQKKRLVVK
jgi:hypothetical protein